MTIRLMDPSDKLSWSHDWADFLADGDSISSRTWTIDPDASPTLLSDTTLAAVVVDGLTAGVSYRLAEKIVTANGEEAERSLTIICEDV